MPELAPFPAEEADAIRRYIRRVDRPVTIRTYFCITLIAVGAAVGVWQYGNQHHDIVVTGCHAINDGRMLQNRRARAFLRFFRTYQQTATIKDRIAPPPPRLRQPDAELDAATRNLLTSETRPIALLNCR